MELFGLHVFARLNRLRLVTKKKRDLVPRMKRRLEVRTWTRKRAQRLLGSL